MQPVASLFLFLEGKYKQKIDLKIRIFFVLIFIIFLVLILQISKNLFLIFIVSDHHRSLTASGIMFANLLLFLNFQIIKMSHLLVLIYL